MPDAYAGIDQERFDLGGDSTTVSERLESYLASAPVADVAAPGPADLDEENARISHANDRVLMLIERAIEHVTRFDSLETALKLVGRAYNRCPSFYNKRLISNAGKSLRHAIKAERWAASKRRRRHVDEHTRKKNLTTFLEKIADAAASVKQDNDRRAKRLFHNIKQQFVSDLPTTLTKGYTVKEASVVVLAFKVPNATRSVTKIEGERVDEGALYLVENAQVIGVNTEKYPKPLLKAQAVAKARGTMVHSGQVNRPSHNVAWFLVLDFGVDTGFVSFADNMVLEENELGSYESYIQNRENAQKRDRLTKSRRLRGLRMEFREKNIALLEDERLARLKLENVLLEISEVEEQFTGLTTVTEGDHGLSVRNYARLEDHMALFLESKLLEGVPYATARSLAFEQRLAAREAYYARGELLEQATAIRRMIRFSREELERRRVQFALQMGHVNPAKLVADTV